MVRLRLKNPVPEALAHHAPFPHLHPEFPLKTRIEPRTERRFQIVSLPQKDGSFVASIVEAPQILVYDRSRRAAEVKAAKTFLKTPDPSSHPLATTKSVTVDMEFDDDSGTFLTFVKELHGMSTYGETEAAALNNTAEMIRGYIKSMEANRKKIPLPAASLAALKRAVGMG